MALKGTPLKLTEVAQGTGLVLFFVGLLPKCGFTQNRQRKRWWFRGPTHGGCERWLIPQTWVRSLSNWGTSCHVQTILKEERGQDMAWYWQCWGGTKARITFFKRFLDFPPHKRGECLSFFISARFVRTGLLHGHDLFQLKRLNQCSTPLGMVRKPSDSLFFLTTSTHATGQSLEPNRH